MSHRFRSILVTPLAILTSVLVASSALAALPAAASPLYSNEINGGAEALGSISGTVYDSGDPSKPLNSIDVIAYDDDDQEVASASTIADGTYRLVGLAAGSYRLAFSDADTRGYVNEWWDDATSMANALPIDLGDAEQREGLVTELAALTFDSAPTPTISGIAAVDGILSADTGLWSPEPASLSIQWMRDGAAVVGATSSTYRLTADDAGAVMSVTVEGEKSGYSPVTRTSAPTTDVVEGTLTGATPIVTGIPTTGQVVTAIAGAWEPAPVDLAFEWQRNGTPIPGATASTYILKSADATQPITVKVTGTKPGYTSLSRSSAAITPTNALTSTPVPVITGSARVGSVLTATAGFWNPDPVTLAFQWKRNGVAITGATTKTYTVATADAGSTLTFTVTGSKSTFSTVVRTSAPTAMVTGAVISTSPTPTVTGTARVGTTLTAVSGTWSPAPITLSYQWKRDGVAIPAATASTFTPQNAHAGGTLTVTVTGARVGYTSVSKTSIATAIVVGGVLTPAPVPTIAGSRLVGSALTAVAGTWGPSPVALSYQWKRSGVAIVGATASTYTLTTADAGSTISVTVTGSKSGFGTSTRSSAPTTMITGAVLTATPVPMISGATTVGSKLTATSGAWAPAPVSLVYQWKRAGASIVGATGSTYALTSADLGSAITLTVTGSRAGFTAVTKTSAAVTPPRTFSSAPTPTIAGTAKVGSVLTAAPGAWSPAPTFTYQWTRNGVNISKATASSYTLVAADAGQPIRVVVTGSKTGYTAITKTSVAVTVPLVFTTKPTPVIAGTTKTGSTLTANPGTWKPAPSAFTYQWMRNGYPIAGATSRTYVVRPTDVDARISVAVTASRSGYTGASTSSAGRIPVGIAYANCDALNRVYPHGVARIGVTADMVSGKPKALGTLTFFSTTLYNLNPKRDGDGDGVACEKH